MLLKENSHKKEIVTSSKSKYYVYYFFCNCGKEIKAQSSQLKRHSGKCQRCCQLGEPYMFIYNELKNHRNKKVEFNLTFEELKDIISLKECHYCSMELNFNEHSKNWGKNLSRAYQLDRKDNNKGYIKENIVPCCWNCNRLKSNIYSYDEFMLLSPILKGIQKNKNIV